MREIGGRMVGMDYYICATCNTPTHFLSRMPIIVKHVVSCKLYLHLCHAAYSQEARYGPID